MKTFLQKHAASVTGILSGFDRLVFRGSLREIGYVDGTRRYLSQAGVLLKAFGAHAEAVTERIKAASVKVAQAAGRPVRYLPSAQTSKEGVARGIAARDSITEGLVCVLTCVEPCTSFEIHRNAKTKRLELQPRLRKCLHHYHYRLHPKFGLMHARIQTWFPFAMQIWLNGREWLARTLDSAGIGYRKQENCFVWVEDVKRAQRLFDAQLRTAWPKRLDERYLDALAQVDTEKSLGALVDGLCCPVSWKGKRVRALHPWGQDAAWLDVIARGEFAVNGLRNRDLRGHLFAFASSDPETTRRHSGQVTRRIRLLRAHGLLKKVPCTHRYVLTEKGRTVTVALNAARNARPRKLTELAA